MTAGGPPSRTVDLVVPELHAHDATSAHTRHLRDLLVEDGHRVRLVAERADTGEDHVTLRRWAADADVTILQHAIGSAAADEVVRRKVPVVVNYHNVTPAAFVEPWSPELVHGLRLGRDQLWRFEPRCRLAVADSAYNAAELRAIGYPRVAVAPVLFEGLHVHPPATGSVSVGRGPVVVFVGRVAPNKCQQDLVAALAVLRGLAGCEEAELVLVGGVSSGSYRDAVVGLAAELGVGDAVRLVGSVSVEELVGWYGAADVFVCVSEHEGFCVPLVEAMGFGVPVVAFGAAAVPETVGDAGLVLGDKSPVVVAEAVRRVVGDAGLREELAVRGRRRAEELGLAASTARMRAVLTPVLEDPLG